MTTTNPTPEPKAIADDKLQPKLRALVQDLEALHAACNQLEEECSPASKVDPKWREKRRGLGQTANVMSGRVEKGLAELHDTFKAISGGR